MNTSHIVIETKNLSLEPISMAYKEYIFREFTPVITKYMYPKSPDKIEETIEFIEKSMKENIGGSNFQLVVLNKNTRKYLGNAGIHHIDTKTPELGIWIKESAHGHGYGKEAVVALKEWADQNLNYKYILYPVARENYPSRKIPEFFGAKIAREYDSVNMMGERLHLLEYRIYSMSSAVGGGEKR